MKYLNALTLRRKFGGIIDEVCRTREPLVITRANKPLVVMLSYEEYKELAKRNEDARQKTRRTFQGIKEWASEHEGEIERLNAVGMIREMRQGR